MKILNLLGAGLLLGLTLVSCKKEEPVSTVNNDVSSTKEMVVPASFDYSTTRDLNFDITSDYVWGKERVRLDIYDFTPKGGGSIVQSKLLEANGSLTGVITLPVTVRKVYAVLNFPDGSSIMKEIRVEGNTVSYDFSTAKKSRKTSVTSTNCNSGCDQTVNNNSSNYSINSNDPGLVYCFTGNTTGKINVNKGGVTVRICGTANLSQISLNNGSYLEITDGANVTINNLSINSNGSMIVYDANLTISNNFSPSGPVTNYGDITVTKQYNLNSNAHLYNYGTVTVNNKMNSSATLTNYGVIDVDGDVALNSSSSTYSVCKMLVGGKMDFNAAGTFEGYLGITGKMTLNSGGVLTLKDGAMLECASAEINNSITGSGSYTSLVKVAGNTTINGGGSLNGSLEYCDADGVETNWGAVNSPAVFACNVYIPTSACNPSGNGTPQIVDSDNDGVADDVDLYPNDPDASGASYYPGENQFATIAFEDLWPYAGDYDLNDLVVGYSYRMVTNSVNKVVRIEAQFVTKAIGASRSNGFGVELDCAPSLVKSVAGNRLEEGYVNVASNGTEMGQGKATIVVFDNAFLTMKSIGGTKFVNTVSTEAYREADTLNVVVEFNGAVDESQIGQAPFNPFMIIEGNRGQEVHLPDHTPTSLADANLFGVGADDTQPANGKYYKSEKNHPWALNVAGDFDYPQEKNDIVTAYNFFASWAQSGGVSNTDWFVNLAGYRNLAKVY